MPQALDRDLRAYYRACELCPRRCGVDRARGERGVCNEGARMRIAAVEAHMGEEPPLSGTQGSGTVFFGGCSLGCSFCQNHQISQEGLGRVCSLKTVVDRLISLHRERGIHNVNFVTPDHFFPHTVAIVRCLQDREVHIPTIYNTSGYQRVESLRLVEPVADIYLPDFKYADSALAQRVSGASDYVTVSLEALSEMVRQKGFLDVFAGQGDTGSHRTDDPGELAREGILVRHLVLPGHLENSLQALTMLFLEFGQNLPLSLMGQYTPVPSMRSDSLLSRVLTQDEFERVLEHAQHLGFRNLFVQRPDEVARDPYAFLPDFRSAAPFRGNPRPEPRRSRKSERSEEFGAERESA